MEDPETPVVNGKHHKKRKKHKEKNSTQEHDPEAGQVEQEVTDQLARSKSSKKKHKNSHRHSNLSHHANGILTPSEHLAHRGRTPFHHQTFSLYLSLSPIGLTCPLQSLCAEHLSPLLLTYYPPFGGVILSYSNVRLSTTPGDHISTDGRQKAFARSVNEYSTPFIWLTADFLILNPQKGDDCEGYVIVQNESSIGLVCWNFFSASIEKGRLPQDWTWIASGKSSKHRKLKLKEPEPDLEEMEVHEQHTGHGKDASSGQNTGENAGHWVNGEGEPVSGIVKFKVRDVDASSSTLGEFDYMSILGTMLDERTEQEVQAENAKEERDRLKNVRVENTRAAKEGREPEHGYTKSTKTNDSASISQRVK